MVSFGKENATDSVLDIVVCDGDQQCNYAISSSSHAAGWTVADIIKSTL